MKVTRLKAAGVHLAISAVIAGVTLALIFFVWYPQPLFSAIGGQLFVAMIVGIDLCLGPLLTLVVYNPAKVRWKLIFNLSVIGIFQVVALVYGVHVAFESRPAYIAYAKERFAVVTADFSLGVRGDGYPVPEKYQSLPLWGIEWVGVKLPTDKTSLENIEFVLKGAGVDVHAHAKYYVDIAESRNEIRAAAKPIARLKELNPDSAAAIDKAIAKTGKNPDSVAYLPLMTPQRLMSVLIDKDSGEALKMVKLTPE